jgi:hypothetical protein
MIRARNIYGFGEFSEIASLIPDSVPSMMNSVETSLSYPAVTISFTEPFENGRAITQYEIQIYSYISNAYETDLTFCDGSQQATIDLMSCTVQMSTLLNSYGFSRGQLIIARVRAYNQVGWGQYSSQNSAGVHVQTEPTFMNVPIINE